MPPPTAEQLAFVERLVGAYLPTAYVELLRFSNGGYPELDTVTYEGKGGHREWSGGRFFRISATPDSPEDVVWNYHHWQPDAPHAFLPIAENAFGDYMCLDLSQKDRDRVVIWWHEIPDDEYPFHDTGLSFEEMIDALRSNPEAEE